MNCLEAKRQSKQTRRSTSAPRHRRRAFSLLELIIVIAVAMLLTGLLMPALRLVHENAHRLICMSHLQQMGQGFVMYTTQYHDQLPYSAILADHGSPTNLMAAHRGGPQGGWDGHGLLFSYGFIPINDCFYCPSHAGDHAVERYADRWFNPAPYETIFTNYHYAGHLDWISGNRRSMDDGVGLVLVTDGLRTIADFNHGNGMNCLRGDGSVRWREDTHEIVKCLPITPEQQPEPTYSTLWELVSAD